MISVNYLKIISVFLVVFLHQKISAQNTQTPNQKKKLDDSSLNSLSIQKSLYDASLELDKTGCNDKVLNEFFSKRDLNGDFELNSERKSMMCQSHTEFCCSSAEMVALLNNFKKGKRALDLMSEYNKFFFQNFKYNSFKKVKKIILGWKTANSKMTMDYSIYSQIEDNIDYIQDRIDKINLSFNIFKDFLLRFYSGFMCEICSRTTAPFWKIRETTDESSDQISKNTLFIGFSPIFLAELYSVNAYFVYYMKFLSKLTNLVELYVYNLNDIPPERLILDDVEYQRKLNQFTLCRDLLKAGVEKKETSFFSQCEHSFDLIKSLRSGAGLKVTIYTLQNAHDFLSKIFPVNFYMLKENKKMSIPVFFEGVDVIKFKKTINFEEYIPQIYFKQNFDIHSQEVSKNVTDDQKKTIRENIKKRNYEGVFPTKKALSAAIIFGAARILKKFIILFVFCMVDSSH